MESSGWALAEVEGAMVEMGLLFDEGEAEAGARRAGSRPRVKRSFIAWRWSGGCRARRR
ncbi:hypothetical protein SAV31267_091800 [Streptomyces avermitilis]|uniref:Uncharacterized protein n=1 Tax=Streptomyces avermitilis TaxID=33903 RepID=A0A4D4N883_STRAX|nr:hypothetical protein SAV31267_091800 [Streptomyces avermitilis]